MRIQESFLVLFSSNPSRHIRHPSEGWGPILVVPKLAMFALFAIFGKNKWDASLRWHDGHVFMVWKRKAQGSSPET
jgi:hypothetical protein